MSAICAWLPKRTLSAKRLLDTNHLNRCFEKKKPSARTQKVILNEILYYIYESWYEPCEKYVGGALAHARQRRRRGHCVVKVLESCHAWSLCVRSGQPVRTPLAIVPRHCLLLSCLLLLWNHNSSKRATDSSDFSSAASPAL